MFLNIKDVKEIRLSEDKCFLEIEFHSPTKIELDEFKSPESDLYPCVLHIHRSFTVILRDYSEGNEILIER